MSERGRSLALVASAAFLAARADPDFMIRDFAARALAALPGS